MHVLPIGVSEFTEHALCGRGCNSTRACSVFVRGSTGGSDCLRNLHLEAWHANIGATSTNFRDGVCFRGEGPESGRLPTSNSALGTDLHPAPSLARPIPDEVGAPTPLCTYPAPFFVGVVGHDWALVLCFLLGPKRGQRLPQMENSCQTLGPNLRHSRAH